MSIVFFILYGGYADAQTTRTEVTESERVRECFSVGMTYSQVEDVLGKDREFERTGIFDWDGKPHQSIGVGGLRVVLDYAQSTSAGELEPGDRVVSMESTRFDDLRGSIPDDLFAAVKDLSLAPTFRSLEGYNPVALVRATNALLPLGKEKAIRALRAYEALAGGQDLAKGNARAATLARTQRRVRYGIDEWRVFLISRMLFVRGDGKRDLPRIGNLELRGVTDVRLTEGMWPQCPLIMSAQIPYLLPYDMMLGGGMQQPEEHLRFYEEYGVLRQQALAPSVSPVDSAEALVNSSSWKMAYLQTFWGEQARNRVRLQALVALVPYSGHWLQLWDANEKAGRTGLSEVEWQACLQDAELRNVRWSSNEQRFVLVKQ